MRSLEETNPMLGTRGVRLGVIHPEIYEMQVRVIACAAREVRERSGLAPRLEVMIPLVAYERELELVRTRVLAVADEERLTYGSDFSVGTMIELPRACMIADRIARHAAFFSVGSNDLTQAGIGFSRRCRGRIIPGYVEQQIVDGSPFAQIDELGVGELVRIAISCDRRERPDLELGVCGEHGGDPDSIRFFHEVGLGYVSARRSVCRSPASRRPGRRSQRRESRRSRLPHRRRSASRAMRCALPAPVRTTSLERRAGARSVVRHIARGRDHDAGTDARWLDRKPAGEPGR